MARYFLRISLIFLLIISVAACGEKPSRKKGTKKNGPPPKVDLPVKGSKVAFIFPAGAGAMRVSLGITAQMEKDLGAPLNAKIDMAGGVSSGALVAAALTSANPPQSSENLRKQMGGLMQQVFPDTIELVDKLIKNHRFIPSELEIIFKAMLKGKPDLSSADKAATSIISILTSAAAVKPTIGIKAGDGTKLIADIAPTLAKMAGYAPTRAQNLKNAIDTLIGSSVLSDPSNSKLVAISSSQQKAVFFAAPAVAKVLPGPVADGATEVWKALVSSAAIPGFIEAPKDITFHESGGGSRVITDLEDGFFAAGVGFDPTAILYDIFTKQFAGQDLLMIFVGNGAPEDADFRKKMKWKDNVSQTEINGKKVTLVDIKAKIVDGKDENLFNLSGFYDSVDMAKYMDNAAKKATEDAAYKWAIEALKAAR